MPSALYVDLQGANDGGNAKIQTRDCFLIETKCKHRGIDRWIKDPGSIEVDPGSTEVYPGSTGVDPGSTEVDPGSIEGDLGSMWSITSAYNLIQAPVHQRDNVV